jgi:hypothetical protein
MEKVSNDPTPKMNFHGENLESGKGDNINPSSEKHIRTGEEEHEQLVIPHNRLVIVFIGLMLTVFLAALDQTIVGNVFYWLTDDSNCSTYHCS